VRSATPVEQVERLTGIRPNMPRWIGAFGKDHHPKDVEVLVCDKQKRIGKVRKLFKRRSAIEPVISHAKSDHSLGRNYLKGQLGDCINVCYQVVASIFVNCFVV